MPPDRFLFLCAAFLAALAFSSSAGAQPCRIEKQATLPVTFRYNMPTVPVTINGLPMSMALDTGSELTTLTPEIATQLHLTPYYHRYTTNVRGAASSFTTVNAIVKSMVFGGVEHKAKVITIVPLAYKPTANMLRDFNASLPLTGLIGGDMLSGFDVEYDPSGRTATLYRVSNCAQVKPPWEGKYAHVRGAADDRHLFFLPVTIDGHEVSAALDTGATRTSLGFRQARDAGVTQDMLAHDRADQTAGVGATVVTSYLHRFGSLGIAGEQFHSPLVQLLNFPRGGMEMLLGEDYMFTRRFWLSYSTGTLFIQPHISGDHADEMEMIRIGLVYLTGNWTPKDAVEAAQWMRKGAQQNYPLAQAMLGCLYHGGVGVEKNPAEAVRWWSKAAPQGLGMAQARLGNAYLTGDGVARDIPEALKWLRMAAEHDNRLSQRLLGEMYHSGVGVEKNEVTAVQWWRKAAAHNEPMAEFLLGRAYANGAGVDKSDSDAVKWYRKAAEHGNEYAQFFLGDAYSTGKGIQKNAAEAYKWYWLAAAQAAQESHNEAELKAPQQAARSMSPGDAARAKALADDWQKSHAPDQDDVNFDRM